MADVNITINGIQLKVNQESTIYEAAKINGIKIPTFCYHPRLRIVGACRICVVEIEGGRNLQASCSTPVREGMKILTQSERVIEARRTILELLLANHDLNCPTCRKNLNCKLQTYSKELMIEKMCYEGEKTHYPIDNSSVSIVRQPDKCIKCERCVRVCNDIQTVHAIENFNRGFKLNVSPPFNHSIKDSACINCGQCVVNCPVAALIEKTELHEVIDILKHKSSGKDKRILVAQTAPSIRAALGECFGMEAGTSVTGKMVTALKRIGFDKVFDTDLCADMTIVEEATEFIKRFTTGGKLPLITTCCPAWIKFGEQFYFEQLEHMSTCRSPQAMMGSLIKNYYAKKIGVEAKDIVLVDIMPCTAKKYEIKRPEFKDEVDFVLTTVELGQLIKIYNVDFVNLQDGEFDNPLGESTGAATIFGRSGGVMEAALRTAADILTGQDLKEVEYNAVRGINTFKEAELEIAGKKIKIAVIHTLGEARKVMEMIKTGNCPYHFIEIMACYGGCIGGGGQPPISSDEKILIKRAEALNNHDRSMPIRKSHKNPALIKIYQEEYGEFGSQKAHKFLHTHYCQKDFIG
jgi:NADP-reducing hydrogenase subunit HndD